MKRAYEVHIVKATAVILVALVAVGRIGPASAKENGKPVVEKLKRGEIDWTNMTIMATGTGAPDRKLPNVAEIRLNAERAAKLSAHRNVLEALKSIRISGNTQGRAALSKGSIRTQVEGIVRGCKIVDTRYYSDGGVDVVLRCPLNGGLAASLAPVRDHAVAKVAATSGHTGLVLDASGLGVKPALHPEVVDAKGQTIYGAKMIAPNALREHGAATYVKSIPAAKAVKRLGDKPLVVKVLRLDRSRTKLVVKASDLTGVTASKGGFLAQGKVVIVTGD